MRSGRGYLTWEWCFAKFFDFEVMLDDKALTLDFVDRDEDTQHDLIFDSPQPFTVNSDVYASWPRLLRVFLVNLITGVEHTGGA